MLALKNELVKLNEREKAINSSLRRQLEANEEATRTLSETLERQARTNHTLMDEASRLVEECSSHLRQLDTQTCEAFKSKNEYGLACGYIKTLRGNSRQSKDKNTTMEAELIALRTDRKKGYRQHTQGLRGAFRGMSTFVIRG